MKGDFGAAAPVIIFAILCMMIDGCENKWATQACRDELRAIHETLKNQKPAQEALKTQP